MTPIIHMKSYEIHPFMVSSGERGLNLKGLELLVYALIYQYCDEEYGRALSITDFVECCNCTPKAARDAIKRLLAKGYIYAKLNTDSKGVSERAFWLTKPKHEYEEIESKYKDVLI